MRRKIKRKNGTFFRPFRKAEAFPFGFPPYIREMVALVQVCHFLTASLRTAEVSPRSSPAEVAEGRFARRNVRDSATEIPC